MWSKLGWLMVLAGLAVFVSIVAGVAPASMSNAPLPDWGWLAIAGAGGFIVVLNRRPNN